MINPLHIINALRSPYLYLDVTPDIEVFADTMNMGNRAVTVRCHHPDYGDDMLLKCYYRTIGDGAEIYGDRFRRNALKVYTIGGHVEFADVLIDRWVEGEPLDVRAEAVDCDFRGLSRAFDRMALQLLNEEWAHGDVKPENIICRVDGSMQLIDMDAMWHSGLAIERCHEYGTMAFNHPQRRMMTDGKHIDDFAIALLSTILAASTLEPEFFRGALESRRKTFLPSRIIKGEDEAFNYAMRLLRTSGNEAHYNIGASLCTNDGMIPHLKGLLQQTLCTQYVDLGASVDGSLAADITIAAHGR